MTNTQWLKEGEEAVGENEGQQPHKKKNLEREQGQNVQVDREYWS